MYLYALNFMHDIPFGWASAAVIHTVTCFVCHPYNSICSRKSRRKANKIRRCASLHAEWKKRKKSHTRYISINIDSNQTIYEWPHSNGVHSQRSIHALSQCANSGFEQHVALTSNRDRTTTNQRWMLKNGANRLMTRGCGGRVRGRG